MGWFLNPGMLFFASFGSIPIIIHLLNRQQYKRIQWAAMTFLLAAIKRTHSRLRIENLLLLLVRIAIMVLLALALAQPLLENNPIGAVGETEIHLILAIDNSYSMGVARAGHASPFETARSLGSDLLAKLDASRGDKVSLVLMSDHPDAVIAEPSMQIDFARKKVAELDLSDYGTSANDTFALILAAAKKSTQAHREVVVITDCQRLAWTVEDKETDKKFHEVLTELVNVPGVNVRIVDVGVDQASNQVVESLASESKVVGTDKDYRFVAKVRNYGREGTQRFLTWYVDGAKHDTVPVETSAGDAADVSLSLRLPEAGPHTLTAELDSDPILADNRASLAFDAKQNVQVLLVDGEPSADMYDDEVIFLRLALNPTMTADERVSLYDVVPVRDIVFSETDVRKYDLVIIANLEAIYDENVQNLEAYVKAGGGLLIFLGDRVATKGYNERLYKDGTGLLPAELGAVAGDPTKQKIFNLEHVDFNHPALKYFEHLTSQITDLPIYEYISAKVDAKRAEVHVLARYNDAEGTPAILEKQLGRGKVILVTTSADLEWNAMIGEQGYLILVDQLAKYLVAQTQSQKNVKVGEALNYFLRADQFNRSFSMLLPKQGTASLAPSQTPDGGFLLSYGQTENSGIYTLERPVEPGAHATENQVLSYFAVNVDPREGNLDRISEDELRRNFPEFKFTYQREGGKGEEEGKGDRQPRSSRAWRLLAYAALGLLLAEMFMAQRFGARR